MNGGFKSGELVITTNVWTSLFSHERRVFAYESLICQVPYATLGIVLSDECDDKVLILTQNALGVCRSWALSKKV